MAYRDPAAAPDEELWRATTGVSPFVIGLLLVGPLFLVGVGALTNAVGTMAIAAAPFLVAAGLLTALRRTTIVRQRTLTTKSLLATRELAWADVARLVVPHGSGAALAATSASKLAASLLLRDAAGALFVVPGGAPREVVQRVVASALPGALARAEATIAAGGRYADADGFSGLDATKLHGKYVGLTLSERSAELGAITRVTGEGRVEHAGEPFLIAALDLVLHALLAKRGVPIEVPWSLAPLLPPP
jgi:hypothetical protein